MFIKFVLTLYIHKIQCGVDVFGLYCLQKPHVSSLSMLPLTLKGKEAAFAMDLMAVDSQLRKRDIEDFCYNSYPHNNSPTVTV